jgi:hypothetical protein
MMEGVNSTMIYCKNFCKYHNVPPVQQKYDNKKNTQGYLQKKKKKPVSIRRWIREGLRCPHHTHTHTHTHTLDLPSWKSLTKEVLLKY